MKRLLRVNICALAFAFCFAWRPVIAQDAQQAQPSADQSKNDVRDVKLAQKIRREIVKDKSLSTYAHNVKVIVRNGKVTLRGPVNTEQEKSAIGQIAGTIAGSGNVTDELTVNKK